MHTLRFFSLLLLLNAMSWLSAADEATQPTGETGGTLVVTLSGHLPLRPGGGFLFGDSGMSLFDATALLKRALSQAERRIVLDCSLEFAPGLAVAEELAAVLRSRSADKRVVCLIDNASDAVLALAAACDEVVMVEAGMLNVDGLSLSSDYYADALNRFGIKFFAVTSGAAKTAPEPFTHSRPSAAAIAEHQRLISALDQATLSLSVRQNVTLERLTAARARAPQTAAIAKEYGLIDTAVEPGAWLKGQPGPVRHLRQETDKPDFNSLPGIMAFMNEVMGGEEKKTRTKSVAVVELEGSIIEGDVSVPGYTIAGNDTAALFDRLITDAMIVGVVVRINSGGGSAGASDRAHYALRRLAAAKPVVALFDGVCASGGYYIGCAAKEIMVHRGTITGSIGVFAMVPDLEGTRALFGVHRHTISTGPRTELFSTSAFTADKEAAIRQVVTAVDDRFQGLVAERRGLALDKVHELAGGRVFSGDEAVTLGLADRVGDLPTAVARVRELAGITEPLPLERLPHAGGLAARLGLGGVQSAVMMAAIPPAVRLMVEQAQRNRLQMMTWMGPVSIE